MRVHFDKKLAFLFHPRTASRATADVLERRGFLRVGTHHDGIINLGPIKSQMDSQREDIKRFLACDPSEFTYTCTVRNTFDAISTWFWAHVPAKSLDSDKVNLDYLKKWPFNMGTLMSYYPVEGQFWRFIWDEYPNMDILRYENLREELDFYLAKNDLEPLVESEFRVDISHATLNKPRGEMVLSWDEEAREYVEELYRNELDRLGYTFSSKLSDVQYPIFDSPGRILIPKSSKEKVEVTCPKCLFIFKTSFTYKNPTLFCIKCQHRWPAISLTERK